MKRKIIEIFIKVCIAVFFSIGVNFLIPNLLIRLAIYSLLITITFIKPIYKITNHYFRKSEKIEQYFDFIKFINPISQNLEIVNLGSSSGKYSFDYVDFVKGANWALAPQTLNYDFNILKQYHSYLKTKAFVIVTLCPFSSCIKNFKDPNVNLKYYSFLHPAMIHEYSNEIQKLVTPLVFHPILLSIKLYGIKSFIINIISTLIKPHPSMLSINPMNNEALEKDANHWIKGWQKQFNIKDLESTTLPEDINNAIKYNSEIISNMSDFCKHRNLNLVFIIPPVTKMLNLKLPNSLKEQYIYPLFMGLKKNDFKLINYLDDERFSNVDYYFNSYFLNKTGRKLFTYQLLKDIKLK